MGGDEYDEDASSSAAVKSAAAAILDLTRDFPSKLQLNVYHLLILVMFLLIMLK